MIETRAILTSDAWRDENDWTDQLFEHIHRIENRYGVRCEGEISTFLDERDTEALLTSILGRGRPGGVVAGGARFLLLFRGSGDRCRT